MNKSRMSENGCMAHIMDIIQYYHLTLFCVCGIDPSYVTSAGIIH